MFGFGRKQKTRHLEQMLDAWMDVSLMLVDLNDVKSDPRKYRIVLAFFLGSAYAIGSHLGLSLEATQPTYQRCLRKHLDLDREGMKHFYPALYDVLHDIEWYVTFMEIGVEALAEWIQTHNLICATAFFRLLVDPPVGDVAAGAEQSKLSDDAFHATPSQETHP